MNQVPLPPSTRSRGPRRAAGVAAVLFALAACGHALAADDIVFTSSFEDGEASVGNWNVLQWPQPANYLSKCQLIRVYGVVPGDEFTFTTCVPPGYSGTVGTGDPLILSVFDSNGIDNNAANDDCDPDIVPQLAGWNCLNAEAERRMPCAPPGPQGITVLPGVTYLDVTICPYDPGDGVSPGTAPLHILWQGTSNPNPG